MRPTIPIDSPLLAATFLERPNRFLTVARLEDGTVVEAHLADPGRLTGLLVPGVPVWLAKRDGTHRKTAYDLTLVQRNGRLVSVDTRYPNRLVAAALAANGIAELSAYTDWQAEVRYGRSRIDFLGHSSERDCLVEVKSVTLVRDGHGYFPDAVTARGARHVRELAQARAEGYDAAVLFIAQRDDVDGVSPEDDIDPAFGEALREAANAGVRLLAYTCQITLMEIALVRSVPVTLKCRPSSRDRSCPHC